MSSTNEPHIDDIIDQVIGVTPEDKTEPIDEPHIDDILAQIIAVIPEDETELIKNIKRYDRDLWNQAPELRNNPEFWLALQTALRINIPDIDTPWKVQILKIFNGTA